MSPRQFRVIENVNLATLHLHSTRRFSKGSHVHGLIWLLQGPVACQQQKEHETQVAVSPRPEHEYHLLAAWPWINYSTSLSLSYLIIQPGIINSTFLRELFQGQGWQRSHLKVSLITRMCKLWSKCQLLLFKKKMCLAHIREICKRISSIKSSSCLFINWQGPCSALTVEFKDTDHIIPTKL